MELLITIYNIFLIALGFGLLIFVHELGHFIAAKWAGIRTEAFAIGMGPVVGSWRRGAGIVMGSTTSKVTRITGKKPDELSDEELTRHNLGETEYSLRWLPLGGFVKMLGQEDANPSATSDDPRSYTQCPVGKRMIVVSAGVIMNIILAVVLFVIAFSVGVNFNAPVIGGVAPTMPAGAAVAENAEELGVSQAGLKPGDRVLTIDGDEAKTFSDLVLSAAMSRPNVPLTLTVRREGYQQPLRFSMKARKDPAGGLLSLGVSEASSNTIRAEKQAGVIVKQRLEETGLAAAGVEPGWTMVSAESRELTTHQEFEELIEQSDGEPIETTWVPPSATNGRPAQPVSVAIPVDPELQVLIYPQDAEDGAAEFEYGLLGMTPLVSIASVSPESQNQGVIQEGDVVYKIANREAPRLAEFRREIQQHAGETIPATVLRGGKEINLQLEVNRKGMINVLPRYAMNLPMTAKVFKQVRADDFREAEQDATAIKPTPLAGSDLFGLTRFTKVNNTDVSDWPSLRAALREATQAAAEAGESAEVSLTVQHPTPGSPIEVIDITLQRDEVAALHTLGWDSPMTSMIFEPLLIERSSQGNPLQAVAMGFEETKKLILVTYLTIDRLFRRTVDVKQLRGPVGIVHIGAKIIDKGFMYLVFFLAVISVNLAVLNFLPLPIVDGGLFLFLIYEKIKGRPPSVTFQNAATLLGLILLGTLFLVVTWNDVMRLI